jgi:hypothetical protein
MFIGEVIETLRAEEFLATRTEFTTPSAVATLSQSHGKPPWAPTSLRSGTSTSCGTT